MENPSNYKHSKRGLVRLEKKSFGGGRGLYGAWFLGLKGMWKEGSIHCIIVNVYASGEIQEKKNMC